VSTILAIAVSLGLGFLTVILPVGSTLTFGPLSLRLNDTLYFFGRQFVLGAADLSLLTLVYGSLAFWLGAAHLARVHWFFLPSSLGMVALLTAVLAVEPFLYAALLIELVTLLSIPMLVVPGQVLGRGILRFLTFQTLSMPFILYTGWMLSGVESGSSQIVLLVRASLLMGLGFALMLAIFPFHTWIPMLMEESHPYTVTFVLNILTLVVLLFGLGFLNRYEWLRTSPTFYAILAVAGILMVITGGGLAAFEHHLGRILGYTVMVEVGYSLLAISFSPEIGLGIFFALLVPRVIGLGVWALALSILQERRGNLSFKANQGVVSELPFASVSLVIAHFSSVGFPILAGFPARIYLWELLAERDIPLTVGLFLGTSGLLVAALRTLILFVTGPDEGPQLIRENIWVRMALGIGMLSLLLAGLIPQWFSPFLVNMQRVFENLVP
jgi:formate hydrogenlyase subunit 3/multisubunit Na+/H+ antiporter MnhD subunit